MRELRLASAVIILLGSRKENRFSLPNARVLIHQPSTGIHGTAADIQIEATEILKCREKINRLISVETGQTYGKGRIGYQEKFLDVCRRGV